ncbi:MAG: hypothetical protein HYZ51_01190 [Candidatus Doudnabacteria bacterium]|nr:hypothetical protein [Candidatus Doudnabacteria bacterium]
MKKFTVLVIVLLIGAAGFDYWQKYQPQIAQITDSIKSGEAIENIKTEVFTPGGLRAKIEAKSAYLTARGVIELTNEERTLVGRLPLKENKLLNQAAAAKAKDMFAAQYFEHISPLGKGPSDLAKDAGYVYIMVGENLALGNYKDDAALVDAWMNSRGHRANILNAKFTEIGVAVLKGTFEGKSTWLAVQEFGKPASDCPKVDEFLKQQIDLGKLDVDRLEDQAKSLKRDLENSPEPATKEEVDAYNQKVIAYNNSVKVYNNRIDSQKEIVARYNTQVNAFNQCIVK